MSLSGQVALVTGASRGIGRGIALQLGEAGATVYITGRPSNQSDNQQAGLSTLEETANEITQRGGKGIAVFVDHTDMVQVEKLFEKINEENQGQLDILVNNAFQAVNVISHSIGQKFHTLDPYIWDTINNVGLRNHYFCSVYASRTMVKRNKGLIVNIGSAGGLQYLFNVAYGVGKAAVDRMTADMAEELKDSNICVVSIWPGIVKTELLGKYINEKDNALSQDKTNAEFIATGETTEYAGRAIVAVANDRKRMAKSGKILIAADLGCKYGFKDVDGVRPPNMRSVNYVLKHFGWNRTAWWIPNFVKIPTSLLWASTNRFG